MIYLHIFIYGKAIQNIPGKEELFSPSLPDRVPITIGMGEAYSGIT